MITEGLIQCPFKSMERFPLTEAQGQTLSVECDDTVQAFEGTKCHGGELFSMVQEGYI